MIGLNGNRPSSQMRGWSIPAAYRFKSQPHRERSCNLQIAIELQRSAGRGALFGMAKIDFDVITDIAAKCKIDGKPRVLHADIDAGSAEDQPHDSEFRAARRHAPTPEHTKRRTTRRSGSMLRSTRLRNPQTRRAGSRSERLMRSWV